MREGDAEIDAKDAGYLRIANEADRVTVASILFSNGYSVQKVRRKKNGKTYEYFVKYVPADASGFLGGDAIEG